MIHEKIFLLLSTHILDRVSVDRISLDLSLKKIRSTDYETFDQLKKQNFDQVKFDQVIIPHIL